MSSFGKQSDPQEIWSLFDRIAGDIAYDIGANGGLTATMLSPNFNTVIAFEPCKESFDELIVTVPLNVVCVDLALSDHSGTVELATTERATDGQGMLVSGHSLERDWGPHTGVREVECLTLDAAAARFGVPDFIKIDTEGADLDVVNGGPEVFATGPRYVIECHEESQGLEILRLLGGVRFDHPGEFTVGLVHHWYILDEDTYEMIEHVA